MTYTMQSNYEQIKMRVNIAGESIPITVDFSEQDLVRDTEREVGKLFAAWRAKYPTRNTQYILAMIAYAYASRFLTLCKSYEEGAGEIERLEERVSALLASGAQSAAG